MSEPIRLAIELTGIPVRGRGHGSFEGPVMQTIGQGGFVNPDNTRPIFKAKSSPAIRDKSSTPPILRLFRIQHPPAVVFLIIAIVINAIQTVSRGWPWPDIFNEVRERLSPALGHDYAASAIVGVLRAILVVAPGLYAAPDIVFVGLLSNATSPVLEKHLLSEVISSTPAASGLVPSKVALPRDLDSSAVTSALPKSGVTASDTGETNHHQTAKALAGEIVGLVWHRSLLLNQLIIPREGVFHGE